MDGPNKHSLHAPKRGPRSIPVPDLSVKIDQLLALNGRNQKWLARCLSVTEPAISNWKHDGRLPALHAQALCRLLGIALTLLTEDDIEQFGQRLDDAFAPGSGKVWNGFLKSVDRDAGALGIIAEGEKPAGVSLKRVVATKPVHPVRPELDRVFSHQRLRFCVEDSSLPPPLRSEGDLHLVLLIEDGYGLGCLCPTRRHARFARDGSGWQLPAAEQGGFYLDEPFGRHAAFAVATAAPAPPDIQEALRAERTLWAADRLVTWIRHETVPHAVFAKRFFVVPG